jgi:NADH-quinone oxidoreductase subunit D
MKSETIPPDKLLISPRPSGSSAIRSLGLELTIEDDLIVDCQLRIGYLHRGIEKITEGKSYLQIFPCLSRLDSRLSELNNLGFALTVEKMLGLEVPDRGQWIRTIISEIVRLSSHLAWLSDFSMDLNPALSASVWRSKKSILEILAIVTGAAQNTTFIQIGGVKGELPAEFFEGLDQIFKIMNSGIQRYRQQLLDNFSFISSAKNKGVITITEALDFSLSGPSLRASGVDWDLRVARPYCKYSDCDFAIPTAENGDIFDRVRVRIEEMEQSLKIISQCREKMPENGACSLETSKFTVPGKNQVSTDPQSMIRHFKLITEGIKPPPVNVCQSIETPRGEQSWYVVSDGGVTPYRCRITSPGFFNLQALTETIKGESPEDFRIIFDSLDISLEEIDR